MTLPTGAIAMSQVNSELGKAWNAAISLNDANVRTLAGRGSGAVSMGDLRGKSNTPVFSPVPGTYTNYRTLPNANYQITSTIPVVWTWTRNNATNTTVDVASGGTASSILVACSAGRNSSTSVTFNITASYAGVNYSWTISLSAEGIQT